MPAQVAVFSLDNRPVNTSFVEKVASIGSAIEVILVPTNLRGSSLVQWITSNVPNVQEFVVSMDGLAYGGLIESRVYSDPTTAINHLQDTLTAFKSKFSSVPVTAFHSVLRLAPNVLSSSDLKNYENIREWAIKKYEYDYVDGNNKQELLDRINQLEGIIGSTALTTYKNTRSRNLQVNKKSLSLVESGHINKLAFFSDDASLYGLHKLDRDELIAQVNASSSLSPKVSFCSGIDEASVLLTSELQQKYGNFTVRAYIDYSNPTVEKEWAGEFEDRKLHENIVTHIQVAGMSLVSNISEADVVFYTHTPYSDDNKLISMINANVRKAVVIVPSGSHTFIGKLRTSVELNKLLSFCKWGTLGNMIGIGLGHAISRVMGLRVARWQGREDKATQSHVEFMIQRFVEDSQYNRVNGKYLDAYAKSLGGDPYSLGSKTAEVTRYADSLVRPRAITLFTEKFFNKEYVSYGDGTTRYVTSFNLPTLSLPWNRLFEVDVRPEIGVSTSPVSVSNFNDVTTSNQPYAYEHIMKLKKLGIFDGGGANNFYPNDTMIRSHFAKTICSVFKLYGTQNVPNPGYTDVPTSHPFYKEIAILKHLGIMKGNSATTFNPDGKLDRSSVGNVIANVFTFMLITKSVSVPRYFTDTTGMSWIEKEADVLAHVGVASTNDEKMYYPSMEANRAMVATFLNRALVSLDKLDVEEKL